MGTTTFSGPIKAGTISNTTGTTVGADVANVGSVVMAQSVAVTQASGATTITIPANSQIVSIDLSVNVVWDGSVATLGIGKVGDATAFTGATSVTGVALGIISATAGADATRVNSWADIGSSEIQILLTSGNTGSGTGFLTVRYIQGNDLS